jgi:primary-amine oxidase
MQAAYIGFMLKPNGFFDSNPANDVAPEKKSPAAEHSSHCCP